MTNTISLGARERCVYRAAPHVFWCFLCYVPSCGATAILLYRCTRADTFTSRLYEAAYGGYNKLRIAIAPRHDVGHLLLAVNVQVCRNQSHRKCVGRKQKRRGDGEPILFSSNMTVDDDDIL